MPQVSLGRTLDKAAASTGGVPETHLAPAIHECHTNAVGAQRGALHQSDKIIHGAAAERIADTFFCHRDPGCSSSKQCEQSQQGPTRANTGQPALTVPWDSFHCACYYYYYSSYYYYDYKSYDYYYYDYVQATCRMAIKKPLCTRAVALL